MLNRAALLYVYIGVSLYVGIRSAWLLFCVICVNACYTLLQCDLLALVLVLDVVCKLHRFVVSYCI